MPNITLQASVVYTKYEKTKKNWSRRASLEEVYF